MVLFPLNTLCESPLSLLRMNVFTPVNLTLVVCLALYPVNPLSASLSVSFIAIEKMTLDQQ